jgi:phosphopantetheinyl transferase (holo-ACP synthase)
MDGLKDPAIVYNEYGKPFLKNGFQVSISHSGNLIALIVSERHPVGIDIERLRESIIRTSQKFVSVNERSELGEENEIEKLHIIWGAKEVLFKMYEIGEVDFKKDLLIAPFHFPCDSIYGEINKPGFQKGFGMECMMINDAVMVWAAG